MCTKKFLKVFGLLLVVGLLFAVAPTGQAQAVTTSVVCTGTGDSALLQDAINAASDGDTISVTGTCVLTSAITVSRAVTLDGNETAKIQVSGSTDGFIMTTAGATLQGFEIEKTDKSSQRIIWINASNITIANNNMHGQFVIGEGETSRAIVISGGNSGLLITGNNFISLRQPAYISGVTTGTISNNYTAGTKGWVVEGGNLTFTGNTWGTGVDANVYDIALLSTIGSSYYTDVPAMSAANNDAFIEDQRYSTPLLTPVYVDASVSTCTDCGTARMPYDTIQEGVDRVIPGGTVHVAAGDYSIPSTMTLAKAITVSGPTTGEAKLIKADGITTNNIFLITASDVTIQNLTLTLNGAPTKGDAFIQAPDGAKANIQILNNMIYVDPQVGPMTGWQAQAIYFGRYTTNSKINNNTIYNTRSGAVAHYNCEVEYRDNVIYNTKGGIMNYASDAVNALERVMVNNSWGTVHNEWDIVWNSGAGVWDFDEIDLVLQMSQENNDAYVVTLVGTAPILGNRSHVFVNAVTGTETLHPANGNMNLPYKKIQDAIDAVVPGGTVNVAAGTYTQEGALVVSTPNLTIKLSSGTVIQNSSPCFTVEADNVTIISETIGGGKCLTTGDLDGIFVNAGVQGLRIVGIEIDGTGQTTGDGIHFNGAASGVYLVSNSIHDLDGDAIEFTTTPTGSVTIEFNRFYNNGGNGLTIPSGAQISAINNWWGCNAGPGNSGCDTASGGVDYDPWLVLKITSEKQIVKPNETIQIDANLNYNSAGQNTLSDGYVPDGITAEFSVQSPGVVDPGPTETVKGQVSTFFTPTKGGVFNVCVTVDNQTVCTEDIVVPAANAVNDEYRMMFNGILEVDRANGVTKNDFGITGLNYTISLVSGPTHGQLELKADGSFKYIPTAGFIGVDSFVYQLVIYPSGQAQAIENSWKDQATVTISVEAYKIFMPLIQK